MVSLDTANRIVSQILNSSLTGVSLRDFAMSQLAQVPNYNWVGTYLLGGNELILDTYVGEPTDHTKIAVGVGVCGTAVAVNANQVVSDVGELTNYLSCSAKTRSEIVVLIRLGEQILGQIDVDGHVVSAFDHTDETMLERIASVLADRWEEA